MTEPLSVSPTGIGLFNLCPYKYYLNKEMRVESVNEPRALRFGKAFHEAQEAWWGSSGGAMDAYLSAVDRWLRVSAAEYSLSPEDIVIGKVLLRGYTAMWGESKRSEPQNIEQAKVVPMIAPDGSVDPSMVLKGILDVSDPAVDHKTTTSKIGPDDVYWSRLERDLQPTLYLVLCDDTDSPQESILWDVVRAPQLKLRKATPVEKREFYKKNCKGGKVGDPKPNTYLEDETIPQFEARFAEMVAENPEQYFARQEITRTESQKSQARYDAWATGRLILAAKRDGAFPRNTKSCDAFNRECEYFGVCHRGDDIGNTQLYKIRPRRA